MSSSLSSNALSMFGRGYYPLLNTYVLSQHLIPFSEEKFHNQELDSPLLEDLEGFIKTHPEIKTVKNQQGCMPHGEAVAIGNTLFERSIRLTVLDLGVVKLDPDAAMFIAKHELSHLKNNDVVIVQGALLVCNIATSVFCNWYTPLLLGPVYEQVAKSTFMLYAEYRADSFAFDNATEEEIQGFIRLFEAKLQIRKKPISAVTRYLILSDSHPTLESRIKKAQNELKARFSYSQERLDNIKNDPRVDKLKKYLLFRKTTPLHDREFSTKFYDCIDKLTAELNDEQLINQAVSLSS